MPRRDARPCAPSPPPERKSRCTRRRRAVPPASPSIYPSPTPTPCGLCGCFARGSRRADHCATAARRGCVWRRGGRPASWSTRHDRTRSRGGSSRHPTSFPRRSGATAGRGAPWWACSTHAPTRSASTSTWSSPGSTDRPASSSDSAPRSKRSTSSARATTGPPATVTSTSCGMRCAASTCTHPGCDASSSPPTRRIPPGWRSTRG